MQLPSGYHMYLRFVVTVAEVHGLTDLAFILITDQYEETDA